MTSILQQDCMLKISEAVLLLLKALFKRRPDATINEYSIYWTSDGTLALNNPQHGLYFHYGSQIYEFSISDKKIEIRLLGSSKPKPDDISLYESMSSILMRSVLKDEQVPKISRLGDIAKEKLAETDYFIKEKMYQCVYTSLSEV